MNIKLRVLLLQLIVFFTVSSPVFSFDDLGIHDDYSPSTVQAKQQPKSPPKEQRIVPQTDGVSQSSMNFDFLFKGQEDPATVRLTTHPSLKEYTFREKMKYLIWDKKPFKYSLSGTMTPQGIITNGHGFVEEVPCFQNWIFEKFNSNYRFYRTLEPVSIEQGLTTEFFESSDARSYFNPNFLPDVSKSVHTVYESKDIETVSVMQGYVNSLSQRSNGWIYGSINPQHDVALVKLKENRHPEKICQIAESLPSQTTVLQKVTIYQYPFGHPLQKKSIEFADFSKWTHQCVTLGGSSGSALRDFYSGVMIGVHQGGNDHHNKFIPFSSSMLALLNREVYPSNQNFNKKD